MVSGILIFRFEILQRPASHVAASDRWIVTCRREFDVKFFAQILVQNKEKNTCAQLRIKIAKKLFVRKTKRMLSMHNWHSCIELQFCATTKGWWHGGGWLQHKPQIQTKRNIGLFLVFVYLIDNFHHQVECKIIDAYDMGPLVTVENVDPARRAHLIELLDIDLRWRMHKVSDGQRRRVQICMGLLHPFQVCKYVVYCNWLRCFYQNLFWHWNYLLKLVQVVELGLCGLRFTHKKSCFGD